jgi:hypothetical protein
MACTHARAELSGTSITYNDARRFKLRRIYLGANSVLVDFLLTNRARSGLFQRRSARCAIIGQDDRRTPSRDPLFAPEQPPASAQQQARGPRSVLVGSFQGPEIRPKGEIRREGERRRKAEIRPKAQRRRETDCRTARAAGRAAGAAQAAARKPTGPAGATTGARLGYGARGDARAGRGRARGDRAVGECPRAAQRAAAPSAPLALILPRLQPNDRPSADDRRGNHLRPSQ